MIEKIVLERFMQFEEKVVIKFGKGITSLTGPTNSGKSTIIRAVTWLARNRPTKKANFATYGQTDFRVVLYVDGRKITRTKVKGKAVYSLDGKKFKAVKFDVPEEIQALLNLSAINFQYQLDAHFWFHLKPQEVSKELNKVVSLDAIDRCAHNVSKRLYRLRSERGLIEERLKEAREAKEQLAWVKEANDHLIAIEDRQLIVERLQKEVDDLHNLIESYETHNDNHTKAISDIDGLAEVVSACESLEVRSREVVALQELVQEYERCRSLKKENLSMVEEYTKKMTDLLGQECPLCNQSIPPPSRQKRE